MAVSSAYRNPAVGPKPQPEFLNAVAQLECEGNDVQLRLQLRQIETELGRVRTEDKYAPRTIDLDLIWLAGASDQQQLFAEPDITERAHLAVPLAELAPDLRHPASGERLGTIAKRLGPQVRMTVQVAVSTELQKIVDEAESGNLGERTA